MPDVIFEEDDEQKAAREADEAELALFKARLETAELLRRAEVERVRAAMSTLETAPPAVRFDLEVQRAVAGTDLKSQACAAPSLGGQTQANNERIAREVASAEQAHRNELASRARWVESHEDVIRNLCAGQTEDNKRLIRAQFFAQKAGG